MARPSVAADDDRRGDGHQIDSEYLIVPIRAQVSATRRVLPVQARLFIRLLDESPAGPVYGEIRR